MTAADAFSGPHIHHDIGILDDPTTTPAERARVVAHLRECLACSQELVDTLAVVAELRATAAVPFPDVAELPPLHAAPSGSDVAAPVTATVRELPRPRPGLHRYRRPVAAVAAGVVLLAGGWAGGHFTGPDRAPAAAVTATVALDAVAGSSTSGHASMTGTGENQIMHIQLSGLPPVGPGEFYSVALIPRTGAPLTLGVLVGGAGQFALPARLVSNFVAIDIDLSGGPAPVSLARGSLA